MAKRKYSETELLGPAPQPQGILGKAASVGLSGLQYAGNLLDTPGAVVRNTLGGADPLAPIMHPLSGEGRVSGRDLLRQQGLVGRKDTWGNWAAGTAADIALDPTTYMTFGASALTKAGKLAKAVGVLDKAGDVATAAGRASGRLKLGQVVGNTAGRARSTLADVLSHGDTATQLERMTHAKNAASKMGVNLDDLMGQRLGGAFNIGIPGMDKMTIGASDAGADLMEGAGKYLGAIPGAKAVGAGLQVGKQAIKGLFHGPSSGRFDKYGQAISELAHEHMPGSKRQVLKDEIGFWKQFEEVNNQYSELFPKKAPAQAAGQYSVGDWVKAKDRGNFGKVLSADANGAKVHFTEPTTRATAEIDLPHHMLEAVDEKMVPQMDRHLADPTARVLDRVIRMTADTRGNVDKALERLHKGLPVSAELKDKIKSLSDDLVKAKDAAWAQNFEMGGKGGVIAATDDFQHFPSYNTPRKTGIQDVFRQIPTGHPSVHGREELTRMLPRETVNQLGMKKKYRGDDLAAAAQRILQDFGPELGYTNSKGEVVDAATHAQELASHVSTLSKDWVDKSKRLFDNMSIQDWAKYSLAAHKRNASFRAVHEAMSRAITDAPDGVPIAAAFQKIGLDPERAAAFFSKASGLSGEALANAKVPQELVNAAAAVIKTYETPEWTNIVTKAIDTMHRYFKPGMVLVKPSFWTRNFISGQFANLVSGYVENPSDVAGYLSSWKRARDLRVAGDDAFREELKIMGIMGSDSTLDANAHVLGGAGSTAHDPIPPNPLNIRETSKEVHSQMAAQAAPTNPVLAALGSATQGVRHKASTWMETNAKANRVVEYQNRASLYLYLKDKGYTPEAAAKAVNDVHFDYSKGSMAPFERDVMSRAIPFYVFSRNNIPWTIQRILERPGGPLAQTVKAASRVHSKDELTPDYISETASVPWGTNSEGAGRYLTGFGLGFEDAASFAVPNAQQLGMEALSRTSPLIKGPLEYITGQSFFQKGPHGGRDLEDLDPVIGRTLSNIGQMTGLRDKTSPVKYPGSKAIEHIASNSPLSGLLTGLRTLTDPRKGPGIKASNLLTGIKFSDVSQSAQDRELMNRVSQIERSMGGRTFSISYLPKDKKEELTPQQQADYRMLADLKKLLAQRSRARKAEKK